MSGGTNRKIKDNNKTVKKQYGYDKAYYKYTNYENERKYDDAVARTELQQANLDAQADYRDKIAEQQYDYNSELQAYQFQNEKDAYEQSLKDFDNQVELNSMSGALAQEAEDRKLDEALISKNFQLEDTDIAMGRLKSDRGFGIAANQRKIKYGRKNLKLDKGNLRDERGYLKDTAKNDLKKNSLRDDQLKNDIGFIKDKRGWDLQKANNTYNKAQAPNFVDRINALVKREKETGRARAAGREGLSAEREVNSALAEYGRTQAALVDSLVFAKDDKILSKQETRGTASSQITGKRLDRSINKVDRNQIKRTLKRNLFVNTYKGNKLDLAFQEMRDNALADTAKLKADFGFSKQEIKQDRKKIRTSFDSAKNQYTASTAKIKLDEYAANLAAQGKVLQKPTPPPALPVPISAPRTRLPMPMEPVKAPKPIKGAMGKTSVWNNVSDGLNFGLQVASLATPFI